MVGPDGNPLPIAPTRDGDSSFEIAESLTMIEKKSWSGPHPSPEDMAVYARIDPTLPDRMMKLTETRFEHIHKFEMEKLKGEALRDKHIYQAYTLGQIFALVMGMALIASGCFAIYLGHPTTGATLIGSTLAAVVTAFLWQGGSKMPPGKDNPTKSPTPND